jgi:hypothetical protein
MHREVFQKTTFVWFKLQLNGNLLNHAPRSYGYYSVHRSRPERWHVVGYALLVEYPSDSRA